jgi:hypothetical protein
MPYSSPATPPRHPPLTLVTVEGVILRQPSERHTHSHWITLKTAQGELVRVIISRSTPLTNWIEVGDRVRVSGRMVLKPWADGLHPTLSAHESVKILAGGVGIAGGAR